MKLQPIIIVLLTGVCILFISLILFKDKDVESAIDSFERGEYLDSLEVLNKLSKISDYEGREKILYYSVKSINRLAEELDGEYEEELKILSTEIADNFKREKARNRVEDRLKYINNRISGELELVIDKKISRIIPNGKLYHDFVSGYKGSKLIEDLDFELLQEIERTEGDRLINAIVNYKTKYPNTYNLPQLVKMFINRLNKENINLNERESFFQDLIEEYGIRYPTSPEMTRIHLCKGENVNIRNSPGVEGEVIGRLLKDEYLIQLEKSMDTFQIGDVRDYWYRVANLKGLKGWVFGKFLAPLNLKKRPKDKSIVDWALEDYFIDWIDSNTPKNWIHIENADKGAISFSVNEDKRIIRLNSIRGKSAGLYRRVLSAYSFVIQSRARLIAGDSFTLFAYSLGNGIAYYLKLNNEEIEVSGRKIPISTSDWHEYHLISDGERYAKLLVDGDIILGKIPPMENDAFITRGLYCLNSTEDEHSLGEMEYIKIKH
ncbi:MAG: SH3 domain-containing protein [Spirochaetota bacterium]|nr:SH3 domain-containing protein [Spirochaetota bacterium]